MQLVDDISELKTDVALTQQNVKWLVADRQEQKRQHEKEQVVKRDNRKDDLALGISRQEINEKRTWSKSERLWTVIGIAVTAGISIAAMIVANYRLR